MGQTSSLGSSSLLDLLFDDPRVARCLVAPDGTVLRANGMWLRSTGFELDAVLGADIIQLFPETRDLAIAMHARARAGHHVDVPRHTQRLQGRETWWDGAIDPIAMENGTGLLISARELLTQGGRFEADQDAAHSPVDLLDATFASMNLGVIVYGPSAEVLRMNGEAERILGVSLARWAAADGPPARAALVQLRTAQGRPMSVEETPTWRALHGDEVRGAELVLHGSSGAATWILANAAPIRGPTGEVRGAVATFSDVTEQKQAQHVLDESNARFRAVFEHAKDAILVTDPEGDGRILMVNPTACRLFGYEESEFRSLSRASILGAADPQVRSLIEARAATGHSAADLSTRRKDGSTLAGELTTAFFREAGGQLRAVDIIRDVTERKRAEAELRSMAQFPAENPNPVMRASTHGQVLYTNTSAASFLRALGWTEGEPLPDLLLREVRLVRSKETSREPELTLPDGREWSFMLSASSGEGHVNLFGRDITGRKRAEEALRQSEQRLRALADSIPQLAWTAQPDGFITWYNRRWYEYTGTTPEQMKGWGWRSVHDPAALPAVMSRWKESLATGSGFDMEFPLRGADGKFRRFLTRVFPLKDHDGNVLQWFGTNTDVTDLVEAQEALREADRRKDEFLAMLSHELRNPLAPIRNSIFVLERVAPGSEQAARAREILHRQSDHITRLVDDLLDVTRIARGKIDLQKERLDLREVVRKTTDDLRSLFNQARIELRLEHPAGPVWLDADPTRIAQVLGNLLQNALKFTPPGGTVQVAVAASDGQAELIVRDSGSGIEPAQIERMFEPFAQADQGLARAKGGLGLGLTLARGIADLHGGTVRARSEGPGRGAEFVVRLPLVASPSVPAPAQGLEIASTARDVLLIEDNPDASESLAEILRLEGHRVVMAADGRSGLALARQHHPDFILCDIGLPDMSGYDLAREIRRDEAFQATKLIALTGYVQPEDRRRAAEAGFDAHLPKPPPLEELARLLEGRRGGCGG